MASVPDNSVNESSNLKFPRFDIASDYSDHHYAATKYKDNYKKENKPLYKKIMKEWKILECHLPESIFVRVYEERIDLIRAVIIGPSGTPYHDGLFFFDVFLPSNYPKEPPKVYYHSHGLRLNPNLYANGYVCLSLINTWSGAKEEKWRSKNSTILQLLVSIQGLVLNEEPFYNEPGFDTEQNRKSEKWQQSSLAYTENAFLLSCKTMSYTIRKPPKNFEVFVEDHFCEHGKSVLKALKVYEDGLVGVGHYRRDGLYLNSKATPSEKFKLGAKQVYDLLNEALLNPGKAAVTNAAPDKADSSAEGLAKSTVEDVSLNKVEAAVDHQHAKSNLATHHGAKSTVKEPKSWISKTLNMFVKCLS